jgi:O-methyltransferase
MILKLIKHSCFWNKLRILKQVFLSLKKDPQEKAFQQQKFISSAEEIYQSKTAYFLQGRMDIDPYSFWHNPEFIDECGGYLPKAREKDKRNIVDTCSYDLVRRDMIVLLLRTIIENKINGEIAELGVYKGETAKLIHHYCSERTLNLFDTFEGFAYKDIFKENKQIRNSESVNNFKDTSVDYILRFIEPQNSNVRVFKGYFPETVNKKLEKTIFSFVHLDADLFVPTKNGLEFFYPRVSPGGIILIHDYNAWPGCRKAVDEFFFQKKEFPVPMPDKSGSAVIIKH